MKKNFYLKHSMMAMNDPRMKRLLKVEKLKGIGAYWFILEKLELLPEPCTTLDYLEPFCCKEIPYNYVLRIILEFDLFEFDEEDYFMPVELNPIRKKAEITAKKRGKTTKTAQNTADFDENAAEIAQKTVKNRLKIDENRLKTTKNQLAKSKKNIRKTLIYNDLFQNPAIEYKEDIKDIIITAEKEKEKEETADAAAENKNIQVAETSSTALPPTSTPPVLTCCDDFGRPQRPLQPVRPWRELADGLTENNQWLEIACIKSGYPALLMSHLPKAVEIFKQHIETYDKGGEVLTMSDMRRYFINFVNAGSRTSRTLLDTLLTIQSKEHPTDSLPYRYEERCNGKRTYMGCPIPDDAPPRPDATATWDEETHRWITLLRNPGKPKQATDETTHSSSGNDADQLRK